MIYKGITSFRNFLFDKGILKEYQPDIPSIGIGNLNVGGSGKTPMTDYLISVLKEKTIGVISRGYGRKTKGFLSVDIQNHYPADVGDEPLMIAKKHPEVSVFVSEKRVEGFKKAVSINPEIDCFIFDDVFQHRYLKPYFNILLADYKKPFYNDKVLPYGRLREAKTGAKRANLIIVTKVPKLLDDSEKVTIMENIRNYCLPETPILFAEYISKPPENMNGEILTERQKVILLSGLADNRQFREFQEKTFEVLEHFSYRDHFSYTKDEINSILEKYRDVPVITTAKDWVKISHLINEECRGRFYIPEIKVKLDDDIRKYLPFS